MTMSGNNNNSVMSLRLRTAQGQARVDGISASSTTLLQLWQKIAATSSSAAAAAAAATLPTKVVRHSDNLQLHSLPLATTTVQSAGLRHGDLLIVEYSSAAAAAVSTPTTTTTTTTSPSALHPVDVLLEKLDGKIKRKFDVRFCKHGDKGMCDYCTPLEPYDPSYLAEHKIKHASFHAHLRQLLTKASPSSSSSSSSSSDTSSSSSSSLTLSALESQDFKIKTPCPAKTHEPYPAGICTKCQPSAVTLQTQQYRLVDHVEFESAAVVDNFIQYWRATGLQRYGIMYGRYEAYDKVPLGVKVVVSAIYEPPQSCGADSIQVTLESSGSSSSLIISPQESQVDEMARDVFGGGGGMPILEKVGMIYTDLLDTGARDGSVVCKRHADSYFLSSAEIIFAAQMQTAHPMVCRYAPPTSSSSSGSQGGVFGSRFSTCVITGNTDNEIGIFNYQVSNAAMAMVRDGIVEASVDPALMRVKASTHECYVPEVFYKYKNEYGRDVQGIAKPTFPVEYLLVSATHGFPSNPSPTFVSDSFPKENRTDVIQATPAPDLNAVKRHFESALNSGDVKKLGDLFRDFHLLVFLYCSGLMDKNDFKKIVQAAMNQSIPGKESEFIESLACPSWATLCTLMNESKTSSSTSNSGRGGGGAVGSSSTASSSSSTWPCRHCTFVNHDTDLCEMCGLPHD